MSLRLILETSTPERRSAMLTRPVLQKIRPDHLDRLAIIYVRQSTLFQVRENTGSTTRQYDLVKRAQDLGWTPACIQVVDQVKATIGRIFALAAMAFNGWWLKSVWGMLGPCSAWRFRAWRVRAAIGIGCWKSVRSLIPSSLMTKACMILARITTVCCSVSKAACRRPNSIG